MTLKRQLTKLKCDLHTLTVITLPCLMFTMHSNKVSFSKLKEIWIKDLIFPLNFSRRRRQKLVLWKFCKSQILEASGWCEDTVIANNGQIQFEKNEYRFYIERLLHKHQKGISSRLLHASKWNSSPFYGIFQATSDIEIILHVFIGSIGSVKLISID